MTRRYSQNPNSLPVRFKADANSRTMLLIKILIRVISSILCKKKVAMLMYSVVTARLLLSKLPKSRAP